MVSLAIREQTDGENQQLDQPSPLSQEQPQFTFQDRQVDEHPELVNLAKYMDPKDLQDIGQMCFAEYEEDEDSRIDWLRMQEEWIKLYHGKMKPLDPPWEHSSDDHLPILAEGCAQFHARSYKAFFASLNFVSSMPVGHVNQEDRDRADRVGKYMSWQLGVRDKTYKRRKDRLLKALPLHGSYFTKTYRDNMQQRIVVENVGPIDLVANYTCVGTDVEDLERKTQVIYLPARLGRYYASEAAKFYFLEPPDEMPLASGDKTEGIRNTLDEMQGKSRPTTYTSERPSKILEQHRYLDLDGDGIEEPYIVWIDAATRQVKRIAIRWSWDAWQRTNFKDPLEYFTHYVYLENPDGFYGFGQGHLVGDMNIAADKMLRQVINAGTLQNSLTGFATQQAGIKSGKIDVQLGKIRKLNSSGKITDVLSMLTHPGPSEALWRAMGLLTQRADRLNMVTDMLTGQPEKVYQTGATNALIEQGLMVFSAVQIRVHAALEQELQKIFRLNGIYLDDQQYFVFNDGADQREYMVMRQDFSDDLQVRPAFDPHQLTDRERKQQTMLEYQTGMQNPLIQQSPQHLLGLTRRFYTGMGSTNINEFVPDPQSMMQAMQQRTQAQQAAQQAEQAPKMMAAKTDAIATQADMVAEQRKADQKDRELDLRETDMRLKAAKDGQEHQLDRAETAVKIHQALNPPHGNA